MRPGEAAVVDETRDPSGEVAAYDEVLAASFREHYGRGADVWTGEAAMRVAGRWAVGQAPGRRSLILDVGIGRGHDAALFLEAGHDVVGLDLVATPEVARLLEEFPDRMAMLTGQLKELLPTPRRYDLIWDNGCFHHQLPVAYDEYLLRMRRSLAPGGRYAVSVFTPADPLQPGTEWTLPDGRLTRMFNPSELSEVLRRNGFAPIASTLFPRSQPGKANYLGAAATVVDMP